jgi:putative ABC transport system substrate-binding protein
MIFTTNKPLAAWGRVLHDPDLAQAILDRVLERGRHLELRGQSYRTRHAPLDLTPGPASPSSAPARISGNHRPEFPEPTDAVSDLAAELVRLKVDIIVVTSTPATLAAKNATKTIPVVIASAGDPVGLGLVANLARPGGNITGMAHTVGVDTFGKALELLKEIAPDVRRVAVLSNPGNPSNAREMEGVKLAARSLGVQLQLLEAREPNQLDGAFAAMSKERAGALLVLPDSVFQRHRAQVAGLAAKNRLPSMYGVSEYVKAGGLISYGPSLPDLFRQSATFVDKILRGAKPAELPVQQPTKFELVINLKTAKALGLTIPPSVLARADEVIE